MTRTIHISRIAQDGSRRVHVAWQAVRGQPGWVLRATALAFFLVIAIPVLLLVAAAILVAFVVFALLAGVGAVLRAIRGVLPRDDGRENVRVIRRDTTDPLPAFALLALMLAGAAAPAQAEGLTVEAAVGLRSVGDTVISPDGRRVAYVLSVPRDADEEPGGPRSQIWVADLDGEGPGRRYTSASVSSSSPQWAPDGAAIAFLSQREESDENTQVYLIALDGGEATCLTAHETSIDTFRFSPDGRRIAFTARDPEPEDKSKEEDEGRDWEVVDASPRYQRVWIADLDSGESRPVYEEALEATGLEWTPDGTALVLRAAPSPHVDVTMMDSGLFHVPVSGGAPARLCPTTGKLGGFAVSPDGSTLAFLGAVSRNDPLAQSVFVTSMDGSVPRNLTAGAEASASDVAWVDSKSLLVLTNAGTHSALEILNSESGAARPIAQAPGGLGGVSLHAPSGRFTASADTAHHPGELFAGSADGGPMTRRTNHNPWLEEIDLARTETIAWTGPEGWRIEGVVTYPVGAGTAGPQSLPAPLPLIVHPHGGPEGVTQEGWSTIPQLLAARGFLVLQPNYRGSGGRGVRFSKGDHDDLGGREFADILAGIDELVRRGLADPERVGMGGWSYGGYLSAMAATHHSARFKAAIMGAGISNWISFTGTTDIPDEMCTVHWNLPMGEHLALYWERSPLAAIDRAATPTLILYGAEDARVPPAQGHELHQALRRRNVPTEMVLYPRAGHGVRERAHRIDLLTRQLEWFEKYVR